MPVEVLVECSAAQNCVVKFDWLLGTGSDGVIHTWDMRTRRCMSRFVDEGALHGMSLASSPGQQLLAAGSDAGFVNVYNQQSAIQVFSVTI